MQTDVKQYKMRHEGFDILVIQGTDNKLLHDQYLTLVKLRDRIMSMPDLKQEDVSHIWGLVEFLESIFEQNPHEFPMSETGHED